MNYHLSADQQAAKKREKKETKTTTKKSVQIVLLLGTWLFLHNGYSRAHATTLYSVVLWHVY